MTVESITKRREAALFEIPPAPEHGGEEAAEPARTGSLIGKSFGTAMHKVTQHRAYSDTSTTHRVRMIRRAFRFATPLPSAYGLTIANEA
jgi:hypothetical protein